MAETFDPHAVTVEHRDNVTIRTHRAGSPLALRISVAILEDKSFRGVLKSERHRRMREEWILGVIEGRSRADTYQSAMNAAAQ